MPAQSAAKKPRPEEQSDSETSSQEEEIDYDDLDLNVSYVGKIKLPKPHARPKRQRWTHDGDEPIISALDVPKGWHDREPDLDPE